MPQNTTYARAALMALALTMLGGCLKSGSDKTEAPSSQPQATQQAPAPSAPVNRAEYASSAEQFAGLQRAGLSGDYQGFAGHLKAADPVSVTTQLQRHFRGRPFDVYTRTAKPGADRHQRLVELRSTSGRLYLYVEMDKVPGGWRVAEYELAGKTAELGTQL